ncbi:patatin-like phospholipase family protein [Desulfomonile tiedjei]|uniref:Putative esterase of the alpha-beta hydrolase superfamily n=1 Tax=Desulfomonile tiedjei (strain ATCC 49306 / DSM 6799 / DCB-1) TaxID=706587 RepID=I4C240_DESTA|nr:patatin-like phospholipase family protein [Desulfomonile tiedjei]AFM23631.1 putative esterase of the alpha-beta hydrolase superfamily [Desulfomonile tiedjei DSM 6799]
MRVGIALGGGGVRGLAHILMLQVLDDLNIRPAVISGTSMGAIVGALYASGMSAREIREIIERRLILKNDTWRDVIEKREDLLKWVSAFKPDFSGCGLINAEGILNSLISEIKVDSFEGLAIPLLVVATDYWSAEEIVFDQGSLLPAIQASMAVPGVFPPVSAQGRILVDGGVVNLVPYDLLTSRADFIIAVNVSRVRAASTPEFPNALESVLGTFDIMQTTMLTDKLKRLKPDIYVWPHIRNVRMLDFGKIEEVFAQSVPAAEELKQGLLKGLQKADST